MSMVFCGNCGYRLSAGDQVCPQCGTPADPDLLPTQENPDQPTMASNSLYPPEDAPTQVKMQPPQEPLILAPQDAYEPDAPTRAVQRPSASPDLAFNQAAIRQPVRFHPEHPIPIILRLAIQALRRRQPIPPRLLAMTLLPRRRGVPGIPGALWG